ncbi:threonine ammonia-lyase [Jiangella muralis]|uniref:threonine ammonia-lyase n=1 Tax=Jiangella muralis TaxID=702383 RepID=UPI00069F6068|nr:pyridoxal-phosphate dependent enzyme [Jiangella muralis]
MTGIDDHDWARRLDDAAAVVRSHLDPTPLVRVDLSGFDAPAYLKLESLQPTGAFKVRGALAAVAAVARDGRRVVTASAGNHGLGVAFAATRLGARATVVVPETASPAKVEALRGFDLDLRLIGDGYDAAEGAALRIAEEDGGRFVSAYTDPDVIAGQATMVGEVVRQLPGGFRIVVPVGGGGLASGTALGAPPDATVVGVEASASRAVSASMSAGRIVDVEIGATIADGLAGGIAREALTPAILREHGVQVIAAEEPGIRAAVRELALRHGIVAEGSAAVGIAAARAGDIPGDQPTVFVITGRNIAADRLADLVTA